MQPFHTPPWDGALQSAAARLSTALAVAADKKRPAAGNAPAAGLPRGHANGDQK